MNTQSATFYGTFHITIDLRGRVVMPAKIREKMPNEVMLVQVPQTPALLIYTESGLMGHFEVIKDRFKSDKSFVNLMRDICPFLMRCQIGADGRFLVTPYLRQHAKLKRDCALIGVGDHLELWDRTEFQSAAVGNSAQ
ncbi:MAG TPA: hypothetical protein DCZ13_06555 [Porticoccaceae bacterium]|nr:hypothetical protein [Porticoccaceae bacterium]